MAIRYCPCGALWYSCQLMHHPDNHLCVYHHCPLCDIRQILVIETEAWLVFKSREQQ